MSTGRRAPSPSPPTAGDGRVTPGGDTPPGDITPGDTPPGGDSAASRELLRALGAVASTPPPQCRAAAGALGLPVPTAAEHTSVFVLWAPPHAAIYLGAQGKLGGDGSDLVAGFWRALGMTPPHDADHLGALLMLHAELGDAAAGAHRERTREQMLRARDALLWEYLWSWAPGYLTAVERLATPSLAPWARLTLRALGQQARLAAPPAALPLALRSAPPPLTAGGTGLTAVTGGGARAGAETAETAERGAGAETGGNAETGGDGGDSDLPGVILAPARSGLVLTREDLRRAAEAAGVGYRLGERRYTLQAMLDQDPVATLGWLASFAHRWAGWHAAQPPVPGPDPRHWWAGRAAATEAALAELQRRFVAG